MALEKIVQVDGKICLLKERIRKLKADNQERQRYLDRWHAQHEIRNLMGRFAIFCSAGQFTRAAALFSETNQVYLQQSDVGIYEGRASVYAYFEQLEKNAVAGSFRMIPITSEVIEVAGDGESAQGMWFINGLSAVKDPGNLSAAAADLWINDKLAVEFVRENGAWRILRMNINEEMRATYYKSWGEYAEQPDYPAFDHMAEPDRPATRHKPFSDTRKSGKNLTTPEPYGSYADLADHY